MKKIFLQYKKKQTLSGQVLCNVLATFLTIVGVFYFFTYGYAKLLASQRKKYDVFWELFGNLFIFPMLCFCLMFIYYSANINEFFTQQIAFCQNMKSLFGDIDQMSSYYFGGKDHKDFSWMEFLEK